MASQGKKSIIHRKAEGGRLDFDARVMSPAKALRLALAKSADKLFDLVLTVTMVQQVVLAQGKIRDEAGNNGLLIVLDGAGGTCGAAKFDMQFLAGLIEVQTTGIVAAAEAMTRPMTITDAAMVSPMVNAVMQGFDAELSEALPGHRARGFRFGDMIEDGRALSLVLDAPEYDLFRLSVDLGEGAKTGMLTLILPVQPKISQAAKGQAAQADASDGFKGNALDAPVTMDAVVARIKMPLNEICQLAQGSILLVPTECLSKTELVAAGNHVVSEVLLGQMNGLRAVRFAPSEVARAEVERGEGTQISEPEGRGGLMEGSAVSGGEILEGHAVELGDAGRGAKKAAGEGGDAQNLTGAAAENLAPDAGSPSVDLSELDALPEEV